jgi:hypothetical protein
MTDESNNVRAVSWIEICPWVMLFSSFRVAIGVNVLLLALGGTYLSAVGWKFAGLCFQSHSGQAEDSGDDAKFRRLRDDLEAWPGYRASINFEQFPQTSIQRVPDALTALGQLPPWAAGRSIVEPIRGLFDQDLTWSRWLYFFCGGLWNIAVWSLFGLAITRIAVVALGRRESVLISEATVFAVRKWLSCFSAPLIPLMFVFAFAIPLVVLGWLMRANVGVLFAGVLWFVMILIGLCMAVLSLGLMFGWPLMWGVIASEGTDAFDAISRSYSYTFQKPLQYLFYGAITAVLGALGWLVLGVATETIIILINWAVSSGTGADRWHDLRPLPGDPSLSGMVRVGVLLMDFFNSLVRAIVPAFGNSFLWVAAGGTYLLLRQNADQAETNDVFLDEDEQSTFTLPPIEEDPVGVTKVRPGA